MTLGILIDALSKTEGFFENHYASLNAFYSGTRQTTLLVSRNNIILFILKRRDNGIYISLRHRE